METFAELFSSLGVPVACLIAVGAYVVYLGKIFREELAALREELTSEREAHKDETTKMVAALNNNTLVMQQLVDKIGAE